MQIADLPIRETVNRRAWNEFKAFFGNPVTAIVMLVAATVVGVLTEIATPEHWLGGNAGLAFGAIAGVGMFTTITFAVYAAFWFKAPVRQRDEARSQIESSVSGLSIEIDDIGRLHAFRDPERDDGSQIWKFQILAINRGDTPEGIARAWLEIKSPKGTRLIQQIPSHPEVTQQLQLDHYQPGLPMRLDSKEPKNVELVFLVGPHDGDEESVTLVTADLSGNKQEITVTKNGIPERLVWMGTTYI